MLSKIFVFFIKVSKIFSRQNLYKFLKIEINKVLKSNIKILVIGSGGELGKIISNKFLDADIITIDVDEKRKPDILMDVMDLKFDIEIFDIVFLLEVLEHVKEPQKAISEIYKVLKPNGKLIFSTPFVFGLHDKPYDYFRFTKYGLINMLKTFSIVEIKSRNDYIHSILVLYMRLLMSEYKTDKIIGIIFIFFILMTYPIIFIVSKLIKSDNITTGYFGIATK